MLLKHSLHFTHFCTHIADLEEAPMSTVWQVLQLLPQSLSTQPSQTQGVEEGLHLPVSTRTNLSGLAQSQIKSGSNSCKAFNSAVTLLSDQEIATLCWLMNNHTRPALDSVNYLSNHYFYLYRFALTDTVQLRVSRSLKGCCWISTFSWCMESKTLKGRPSTLIIWRLCPTRKW